ncbi:tripartite motif-containing protein 40 isoform X2 [Zalophus californianus]|uniref:Tripartite motif-containing protein 40 isoform X2 n=1 Tax=Zalophus californianus TaxID=9704 RepID=A0A6J2DWK9_ZALCA|nr:tripartite motif-containing protein 40 isoform X2 [Zalophus californianus]
MVPPQEDGRGEGICPICQELLKDAVSTECRHHFCRGCLARHVVKASASGALRCPLCRKPCSEGVLGAGYLCSSHQKKVCYFCEESRLLLCGECLVSPEHQGHHELAIEDALSHYKERLSRRRRRLRRDLRALCRLRAQEEEKLWAVQAQVGCGTCRLEAELESQPQSRREQDAPLKQWPDLLEDTPAPGARILDVSRATAQLRSLVAALDKTTKGLGMDTLKEHTTEIRGCVPPAGEKNPAVPSAILSGSNLPIPGPPCLRLAFTSWLSLSQPIQPPTRSAQDVLTTPISRT